MIDKYHRNDNFIPFTKEELLLYYEDWANLIKKANVDIKGANLDKDTRFLTKLINLYCGYDYTHINDYLRFGDDTESNEYREKSHLLNLIIYLAPHIPRDTIVYRSICPEFLNELKNNGTAYEKGFMSTTIDFKYARRFNDNNSVLKIFVKKDTPCIFTDAIQNREESELLFPPCGGLQLINSPHSFWKSKKIYECKLFYYH